MKNEVSTDTKKVEALKFKALEQQDELRASIRNTVNQAYAFGKTLNALKESMKHGDWMSWSAANIEYSGRQCRKYMLIGGLKQLPKMASKGQFEIDEAARFAGAFKKAEAKDVDAFYKEYTAEQQPPTKPKKAKKEAKQSSSPETECPLPDEDKVHGGVVWSITACSQEFVGRDLNKIVASVTKERRREVLRQAKRLHKTLGIFIERLSEKGDE